MAILIADSGATKCEWCLLNEGKRKTVITPGISPYFMNEEQIRALIKEELLPKLGKYEIDEIHYYGTGCKTAANRQIVRKAIKKMFPQSEVEVDHDLMAAARALCGRRKGMVCTLGTGSNTCYYNGEKIAKSRTGLGYVLGDEGSGAYLGKKVLQYYLYKTFDDELTFKFNQKFNTSEAEILENVYKKPLPNRYLASFTMFLAENRGHYMIENIIEDGLNDFFFQNICKFSESWTHPIHFLGSVAFGFQDVITDLCHTYELDLGTILQNPMDGLIKYHS